MIVIPLLLLCPRASTAAFLEPFHQSHLSYSNHLLNCPYRPTAVTGWVQGRDAEWRWQEDDAADNSATVSTATNYKLTATSTPNLPSGTFRPKQSLGQNYLRDGNTVVKFVHAFLKDATDTQRKESLHLPTRLRAVELGPGAGAITDVLLQHLGPADLQCIEIDNRSIQLLSDKHDQLRIHHQDVLQTDFPTMANQEGGPLSIVGNLPYYITSQILFALADATHSDSVRSATVSMQWEVARRMVAPTKCKDYGILSVVFQLYADCRLHFKIPPTVFYPQPKVDSALVGLHFVGPVKLRQRLAGVSPGNFRSVVTATFQQRRKTVRNGLKNLAMTVLGGEEERVRRFFEAEPLPLPLVVREAVLAGDTFALKQALPSHWASMRPEELSAGQFVEITRLLFNEAGEIADDTSWESNDLGNKVWRKLKHGT